MNMKAIDPEVQRAFVVEIDGMYEQLEAVPPGNYNLEARRANLNMRLRQLRRIVCLGSCSAEQARYACDCVFGDIVTIHRPEAFYR
eukprot:3181711-Rhodomonas_salina.2